MNRNRKRKARFRNRLESCFNTIQTKLPKWITIKNEAAQPAAEILIYDSIGTSFWDEGIGAKQVAEELKLIPKNREITVRINSPGGSIHEGLAIYNLLATRREHVSIYVDGVAASIAAVIALSGKTLTMPKNTLFMIHDPWGHAQGNAEELRKIADTLDKHKDVIVNVFADKTKLDRSVIENMMTEETWLTADEAMENKFADIVSNAVSYNAIFEFADVIENAPDHIKSKLKSQYGVNSSQETPAANSGQQTEQRLVMNREQIVALLNKHGIKFAETATDEELINLLSGAMAPSSPAPAPAPQKRAITPTPAAAAPVAAAAPTAVADPDPDPAFDVRNEFKNSVGEINRLKQQYEVVNAHFEKERRTRIENQVDECISEDRIPQPQREKWVNRVLADEAVLEDLRNMEPRPPGGQAVGITITGDSPKDIEKGLLNLRKPLKSWMRGNAVSAELIGFNAKMLATQIHANRKKLDVLLNTNTVDTDLKRNVILADQMRAFKRKLVYLSVFTTQFRNIPLDGTNKVTVPYFDLDTSSSKDYLQATGYVFDENTDAGSRTVTIDKRKYKSMNFSSDEFRRQPYFAPSTSLMLKAEQLGLDVWLDILSLVTVANYGASVLDIEPGSSDADDIIDIQQACDDADWPDMGRALVLSTAHKSALLKDDSVKHALNIGSTDPIRAGAVGPLFGFETFFSPRIPTNSEYLNGFAVLPPAALVVTSPIVPAPGVRAQLLSYDVVVDPETGIAFEYRYWGDATADEDREVVEVNYGYLAGNASALKRITNGGETQESSSSSSQSSASSTSESSSSSSSSNSSSQSSLSSQG